MLINSQQYKEKWMKIKYKIIHFTIYEKNVLKTYLNNMTNQGWQIEWMSCIIICFYAPNDHDYYTVEFNENQGFTNDVVDVPGHQLKHYEELDYHFICSTKYFSIIILYKPRFSQ